jgi:hypothetical protein
MLSTTLYLDENKQELFLSGQAFFEIGEFKHYSKMATKGTSGDKLRKQMNIFVVQNQKLCEDKLDDNGEIYKINQQALIFQYSSLSNLEGVLSGHNTNRNEGLYLTHAQLPFRKVFPFHGKRIKIGNDENAITVSNEKFKELYQASEQITKIKENKSKSIIFNNKTYREGQILKHEIYTKKLNLAHNTCILTHIIDKKKEKASRASHILDRKICATEMAKADLDNGLYLSLNADEWIDSKWLSFNLEKESILVKHTENELIEKISSLSKDDYDNIFAYIKANTHSLFWQARNAHMMEEARYIEFNKN